MPIPLDLRARDAAASLVDRLPRRPVESLAPPPAGGDLDAVLGEPGLPVVGNTLAFTQRNLEFCRENAARFGPVFWTNAFGTRLLVVLGPDAIGTVLANRDKAFSNREGWGYFIGPFFDRGVMLMDFDEHRAHRRIMQQAFKRERLVSYLDDMNATIARGLDDWHPQDGFEVYEATKTLTLDIATEVFVGAEPGRDADRLNEAFIHTVHGGLTVLRHDVPGGRWHKGLVSRRELQEYFRAQIPDKRRGEGQDLFSVLCHAESEDGERFSDEDVVNHMIFVLMAAHDTSTITLAMLVYYLARHPEWQERLRAESEALGKDAIDHTDLDALPSMDLAFLETLRMNSPVGNIARQALVDTEIEGLHVPAGTNMMVGLYPTMRMEPWWNDPDRFDPERFSEERREDRSHPFAFTPFGGNVHKCIGMHFGGMEVKAILHQLLLRRTWTIPAGYEPAMDYGTGPFPADGLPIALRAR